MSNYNSWSREALIQRIAELEGNGVKKEVSEGGPVGSPSNPPQKKKKKEMDFSKYATRKIALRFAYVGWDYHGLAVQSNVDPAEVPTVEHEILQALHKTRLIPSMDVGECEFSRCGRTDRGVSALRQVISLRVRSNLSVEEQSDPAQDDDELDYLHILNNLLPSDIRFFEIAMRPGNDFDARFSCLSRRYKYFFHGQGLDVEKMHQAAQLFLGEHDFRNFCKVDGSKQLTNFCRRILASDIKKHESVDGLYYFDLTGTAFLWHQVRSMIAILFLVGQNLESPEIVTYLLDVNTTPRRPVYEMAADYPLVLYDCEFPPEIEWSSFKNSETLERTKDKMYNQWHEQYVKTAMLEEYQSMVTNSSTFRLNNSKDQKVFLNMGNGRSKPTAKYQPLASRQTLDPPEIVNRRWLEKKK
jgi:tRNA pseudouridine38/39 synthase